MKSIGARSKEKLLRVGDYPLTLIMAPLGYGKVTVVHNVSKQLGIHMEWYTAQMPLWEPKASYEEETWVVLEHYDRLDQRESYYKQLMTIIQSKIEHLHIILITRAIPRLPIEELKLKRLCQVIDKQDLRLTVDEVRAYFEEHHIPYTEKQLMLIDEYVEGWPAAIYLMRDNYVKYQTLYHKPSMYQIMERGIYDHYAIEDLRLLVFLGQVGEFSLTEFDNMPYHTQFIQRVERLVEDNILIDYNPLTDTYKIMKAFRLFLEVQLDHIEVETNQEVCTWVVKWYLNKQKWDKAFKYLVRIGAVEQCIAYLNQKDFPQGTEINLKLVKHLLGSVEESTWIKYPLAKLRLEYKYIQNMRRKEGKAYLQKMEAYYTKLESMAPEMKEHILLELSMIKCALDYGKLEIKEDRLRPSCIVSATDWMSKECIHLSSFCHRTLGGYRKEIETILASLKKYPILEERYIIDLDYLLSAEYAMYTGNLDEARYYARKLFYRGDLISGDKIRLDAQIILMRVALAAGDTEALEKEIEAVNSYTPYIENKTLESIKEIGLSYILSITEKKVGNLEYLNLKDLLEYRENTYKGLSHYIAQASVLIQNEEFMKLELLQDVMKKCIKHDKQQLLGQLYYYLFEAISKYSMQDEKCAKQALRQALEVGYADHIVLPFQEQYRYIKPLLDQLSIKKEMRSYIEHFSQEKANDKENKWGLTAREWQVVQLIQVGFTNKEIASRLSVAHVTVAKTTSKIYKKMGVNSRVEMVNILNV